jgi:hypothetical protein
MAHQRCGGSGSCPLVRSRNSTQHFFILPVDVGWQLWAYLKPRVPQRLGNKRLSSVPRLRANEPAVEELAKCLSCQILFRSLPRNWRGVGSNGSSGKTLDNITACTTP